MFVDIAAVVETKMTGAREASKPERQRLLDARVLRRLSRASVRRGERHPLLRAVRAGSTVLLTVELLINPPLDDVRPALLESLNRCFPNWGTTTTFHWHLVRTVGGRKTDVMLVRDEHRFVAGSAIVYRPVRLRTGQIAEVGIMASSWTLPEARGHGHFSRIIETSVELARKNGVALLTAYVTSANASARRLLASGAAGYPTHYLIGDGSPPASTGSMPAVVEATTEACSTEVMDASPPHADVARFVYTPQEWREQFWTRPDVVRTLRVGTIGTALVETRNDFDRLLAFSNTGEDGADCLAPLIAWSHARGREVLLLHHRGRLARSGRTTSGCVICPGFLTARIANEGALAGLNAQQLGPWWVRNGDRM